MQNENIEQIEGSNAVASVPDHVQIQTITGCNARCIFCPNGKTRRHIPRGRPMDWDLYRSIVDQSIAFGIRRYSVYLMNEPMLDRELPQRVEYVSARIKKPQYVKITSHGGLLTDRMARGLLDSGLKKLKISVQSLNPKTYRDIMDLELAKTLRNIDRFLELKKQGGYKLPRLEIVMVDPIQSYNEINYIRRHWQERDVKLNIELFENRADQQDIRDSAIGARKMKVFSWCQRLMEQIYILHDGRMVQCCADWEQRSVMGDLRRESLANIWHGERYTDYRRRFAAGDIEGMICARCLKQVEQN
jgi:molybdenum cofactor biosynthesis enzyme MoaA